ncbi:MAG: hypothetical protein AAF989_00395, partial [Planctomycetota bacterium]
DFFLDADLVLGLGVSATSVFTAHLLLMETSAYEPLPILGDRDGVDEGGTWPDATSCHSRRDPFFMGLAAMVPSGD